MSDFKAIHAKYSAAFQVDGPKSEVFPLICPVRESLWLEGWRARVLYSKSGYAEKGCVFTSQHPGQPDTIWLMTEHDYDKGLVRFSRITPGVKLADLEAELSETGAEGCELKISYTWTALSEKGNQELAELNQAKYEAEMAFWQKP